MNVNLEEKTKEKERQRMWRKTMKRKKSEDIKAGGGEISDKHESENGKEKQKK